MNLRSIQKKPTKEEESEREDENWERNSCCERMWCTGLFSIFKVMDLTWNRGAFGSFPYVLNQL